MAAITISRQYGSGGRKVALRVSEILGWTLFDKRLMMQVANDVGLSPGDVVDFTEYDYKVKSFWDRLFWAGGASDPSGMYALATSGAFTYEQMDEEGSVRLVTKAIEIAYERGNVIVLGRGGQVILQDKPDVLHVRVQAPMDRRQTRLETYEDIEHDDTKSAAKRRDKATAKYLERFFHARWDNPELYHLVLNSDKFDIEMIAQLIVHTAKEMLPITE